MSFPHGHDLPVSPEEAADRQHSLVLTHPVLLYDGDTEKVKTDGQTDPGQVASRSPSCLRNPSEATATRARPSETAHRGQLSLERRPAQRHHRARRGVSAHTGSEEPHSRTFRARRVNGPVSPLPTEFQRAARCPSTEGGSGRCSSASLELINWKRVLSVFGEAEG